MVRACAAAVVLALLLFSCLMALAAAAYPGGTYCEPDADGYRFWGNYFCDLAGPVTARGVDNSRSALFTEAAFVSFACAAGPFFWLLGGMARHPRAIRRLGVVSAVATAVLAWLPSRAGMLVHATAVFSATIPGLVAAALGVYDLVLRGSRDATGRALAWLGVATFVAAHADVTGYAYAVATRAGCVAWLPALQKFVGLLLVTWMLATAFASARRAGS